MTLSLAALLSLLATASPAKAEACLGPDEARVQAAAHHFIVFADAVRAARNKVPGEMISANLCRVDGRLMYVLAIMARDGRVHRAIVDPESADVRQLP